MQPPRDRFEFIIRFVCAACFFGVVMAALELSFFDRMGWAAVAGWLGITLAIATWAALHGDEVWHKLINLIRWW